MSRNSIRRWATPAVLALVGGFMAWGIWQQGPALWRAARSLSVGSLALAFAICLVHRVVNARGWAMLLGALDCPIEPALGARIWLASESSRWIPGSVWSYGSRGLIASRRGVPHELALASLIGELLLTLAAWTVVALAFGPWLGAGHATVLERLHPGAVLGKLTLSWQTAAGLAAVGGGAAVVASIVASRWRAFRTRIQGLRRLRPRPARLAGVVGFFVAMAVLNGVAFWPIVADFPGGDYCPLGAIIAANAVSWIVGFVTPVAPGGLVVREACLASLLAPWLGVENAIIAAMAWRVVQIAAEVVTFLGVSIAGIDPDTPLVLSPDRFRAAPLEP